MKYIILILLISSNAISSNAFANPLLGYWYAGKSNGKNICLNIKNDDDGLVSAIQKIEGKESLNMFMIYHIKNKKLKLTIVTPIIFSGPCIGNAHFVIFGKFSKHFGVIKISFGKILDLNQCGKIADVRLLEIATKRWVRISKKKYKKLCGLTGLAKTQI